MFFWRLGLVAKSKVGKLDRDGILLRLHSARAASASSLPVSNTRSYLVLPSASFVRFSATDDDRLMIMHSLRGCHASLGAAFWCLSQVAGHGAVVDMRP
jgi:hypothetical protein